MAEVIKTCLPAFSAQRILDEQDVEETRAAIRYLSIEAPRKWVAGRIVTLLSHYFVAQTDEAVATAVVDDWCSMLAEYPAWAIANACRWWMSRENPRKHCKPLPGDIQERAHIEMQGVRAARIMLSRPLCCHDPEPIPMRKVDPVDVQERAARAQEILQQFGFARRVSDEAAE